MARKKLQAGVTIIGQTEIYKEGSPQEAYVYYGNGIVTKTGILCYEVLSQKEYEKMLRSFFGSEEGMEYMIPTEEEITEASVFVATKIAGKRKAEEEKRQKETKREEKPEYLDSSLMGLLEEGKTEKKEKPGKKKKEKEDFSYETRAKILGITSAGLSLLCLFQMLLNVFLLTR